MTATAAPSRLGGLLRSSLAQVRLRHWSHFLLLPLASVDPAAGWKSTLLAATRGVAASFTLLAFGYLLNSLSDRAVDRDPRKHGLPSGSRWMQWVAVFALGAAALSVVGGAPWPVRVAAIACLLSGIVYSVGPRLKAFPLIGSALNITNFAPLMLLGASSAAMPPMLGPLLGVFTPLLLQNQLIHEAADAPDDRAGGVATTFTSYGSRVAAVGAAACGAAASATALLVVAPPWQIPYAAVVAFAFGLAAPALLLARGGDAAAMARLRLAHRWTALLAGGALYVALFLSAR